MYLSNLKFNDPMLRLTLLTFFSFLILHSYSQYNWKPEKQKNGIHLYLSQTPGSKFKAVKVECTFPGTYAKLISVITNVPRFNQWIYNTKQSKVIKQYSALDYLYYSETHMPFPMTNRDVVIHMRISTDSLPKFMTITGTGEPDAFPEIPGRERVPHYKTFWKVTMPTAQTVQISYILEINPGGSLPAWIVNNFIDKGPYETFINLKEQLAK